MSTAKRLANRVADLIDSGQAVALVEQGESVTPMSAQDMRALLLGVPPEWRKACDEVSAAFSAAQLRAIQSGQPPRWKGELIPHMTPEAMNKSVSECLPRAMQLFSEKHTGDMPAHRCRCRHLALIYAGAEKSAQLTGADVHSMLDSGEQVLNWYLSQVN
jgi:hypothetical protein